MSSLEVGSGQCVTRNSLKMDSSSDAEKYLKELSLRAHHLRPREAVWSGSEIRVSACWGGAQAERAVT
jgi:hypothetical protein